MSDKLKYYVEGVDLPDNTAHRVKTLEEADVFVVKGGDGTLLRAIRKVDYNNLHNIIVMGINTGHVGFLTSGIVLEKINDFISLSKKEFNSYVSNRAMLSTNYSKRKALNEVVLQPINRGKLFELDVEINNEKLTYKGDGVIISTASGSTAYNLSAGGPIVFPDINVMNITPLAPFSLAARPIVVGKNSTITVSSKDPVEITIDGDSIGRAEIKNFKVELATEEVKLFKVDTFFNAIQYKLGWNKSIK